MEESRGYPGFVGLAGEFICVTNFSGVAGSAGLLLYSAETEIIASRTSEQGWMGDSNFPSCVGQILGKYSGGVLKLGKHV